jgi:hypothetical protein
LPKSPFNSIILAGSSNYYENQGRVLRIRKGFSTAGLPPDPARALRLHFKLLFESFS